MEKISGLCLGLSVIAIILAIIGSTTADIWLASTQWVLISATLAIYAIYFKIK